MHSKFVLYIILLIIVLLSGIRSQILSTRRNLADHTVLRSRKLYYSPPHLCALNFKDNRRGMDVDPFKKMIYFVTATYPRPEQIPELIRLSHTLMHVPRIHWVVADDKNRCSAQVIKVLRKSRLPFTLIASPKPKTSESIPPGMMPRGVANRRAALNWIRETASKDGVLYFGDDDNTYDLELFEEIRKTKKLSMFPVGLIGYFGVSAPVLKNGKVVGFFDSWAGGRKFAVDMAGFAVNIKYINYYTSMPYRAGYLEDIFLRSANFNIEDIEPLANNCTKVLVWHTRTVKNKLIKIRANLKQLVKSNYDGLATLLEEMSRNKVIKIDRNGINAAVIFSFRKLNKFTFLTEL